MTAPDSDQLEIHDTSRWPAFAVCLGVAALTILDLSGVNVALPSIQKSLHTNSSELQLIVAGYALAFGLSLVPAGRLGDMRSRRTMFVIGLIGFAAASALCALAPNHIWLTVTRFIQGAAAGVQMPQVLGMVQQLFHGKSRGRAFGVFGAMVGIATAIGPTLCGLLIAVGGTTNGWRLLFWLNVPCGIVALIFALRWLPREQERDEASTQLDPVGLVLLGVAIFCSMLPFLLTTGDKGDDPLRWLWLVGFGVTGVAFLLWERAYRRSGKSPIVHLELFRTRSYRNGIMIAAAYFAAMPATFLITTLYLQEGLRIAPFFAGLVVVPFALSSAITAWIGGRLVDRFGRALVVWGMIIVTIGFALVLAAATLVAKGPSEWFMAGAMLIGGAGGGLVVSPNQTLTLSQVPVAQGGVAGSVQQLGQRIGTAVGVALVTAVFFGAVSGGGKHPSGEYHVAFQNGFFATLALLLISLLIGVVDLWQRRRSEA